MSKDTGGPAFPVVGEHGMRLDNAPGMTLRDYFAAHAPEPYERWHGGERKLDDVIQWRWFYADMMLAERCK